MFQAPTLSYVFFLLQLFCIWPRVTVKYVVKGYADI